MNENDIKSLTDLIFQNIKSDFNNKFLTGQLRDNIRVSKIDDGFRITIDPKIYNLPKYLETKVIEYKSGGGSYASHIDNYGSFRNNHYDYVGRSIKSAVRTWKEQMRINGYKFSATDFSTLKKHFGIQGRQRYEKDVKEGYYSFGSEYLPAIK